MHAPSIGEALVMAAVGTLAVDSHYHFYLYNTTVDNNK